MAAKAIVLSHRGLADELGHTRAWLSYSGFSVEGVYHEASHDIAEGERVGGVGLAAGNVEGGRKRQKPQRGGVILASVGICLPPGVRMFQWRSTPIYACGRAAGLPAQSISMTTPA